MRRSWVVMDLAAVLVFVGIGRSVHAHGLSFAGLFSTAWPFVSGLGTGWLVVAHLRRDAAGGPAGLVVLISTVAVGMVLRVVSGQGTAPAFVGVALGFLGATMLGWRLGLAVLVRRQAPGRTSGYNLLTVPLSVLDLATETAAERTR